jgi:hypothetical protein
MSSSARVFEIPGRGFGAAVASADGVTATAPAAKPSLPDNTIAVLMELQGSTPAERKEWNDLVSERHALNQRTATFITRQLAARHADLEEKHETAKAAVVEQGKVLRSLEKTLVEDTADWIRVDNARRLAQSAAHDAEVESKSLSRFASKKQIAEAEKRVIEANTKMQAAESKAAEQGQHLNYLKTVTIPAENKKLTELIERELELSAMLTGQDPFLAVYGFQQR